MYALYSVYGGSLWGGDDDLREGYYTVEATFIVSICVWLMIALCYGGFYVHDKLLLGSEVNDNAFSWISLGGKNKGKWEKSEKKNLQNKMFLFRIKRVNVKNGLTSKKIKVTYTVPISSKNIRNLFTEKKNEMIYETEREIINPAEYKWTMENLEKSK